MSGHVHVYDHDVPALGCGRSPALCPLCPLWFVSGLGKFALQAIHVGLGGLGIAQLLFALGAAEQGLP